MLTKNSVLHGDLNYESRYCPARNIPEWPSCGILRQCSSANWGFLPSLGKTEFEEKLHFQQTSTVWRTNAVVGKMVRGLPLSLG